jgi:anti-sigma factor RsiW
MNCSPESVKEYFLGEMPAAERGRFAEHAQSCRVCREELNRLEIARAALVSVPDEEPPRRIAFVSDKVFEPRWWQRLWIATPRFGMAAIAVAILVHAFTRPAPVVTPPAPAQVVQSVDMNAVEARIQQEVARRLPEEREKLVRMIADVEKRIDSRRREDMLFVEENVDVLRKVVNRM